MATNCGNVLTLQDLQIAKNNQIFEAEVITGKAGGVASGSDISYATNANTGQVQQTMPSILLALGYTPQSFTFTAGGTLTTPNQAVLWPVAGGGDGQYYAWRGAFPKVIPASSTPASTGGVGVGAWQPVGDITLRSQLATSGSPLVHPDRVLFKQPLGSSVNRSITSKGLEYVSVKDFGAVGDGVTDDTAAFNAAIASGARKVYVPSTEYAYRLTSQITITNGTTLQGDGTIPYKVLGVPATRGRGSWLHFDHPGKGIYVTTVAAPGVGGSEFREIGTLRTHPTPTGGTYTPNVYDWDFEIDNAVDVKFIDVCLLNPFNGIYSHGQQTRMFVDRLYGQPLSVGIRCEEAFDSHRFNNVHFWPYWVQDASVWAYTNANLVAFRFGRCDGFSMVNVFSIFHNIGVQIYKSASGTTTKLTASGLFLDGGFHGYIVDVLAEGHTASLSNVHIHGENNLVGTNVGIGLYAPQVNLMISNIYISNINSWAIVSEGQFNNVGIHDLICSDWGLSNSTSPAIRVSQANSSMWIEGNKRFFSTIGNNENRYDSPGVIHTDVDRGVFNGTTNSNGDVVIGFLGNTIPNQIQITNMNNAPLSFSIVGRTITGVTVRVFTSTGVPLTSTMVALGWSMTI